MTPTVVRVDTLWKGLAHYPRDARMLGRRWVAGVTAEGEFFEVTTTSDDNEEIRRVTLPDTVNRATALLNVGDSLWVWDAVETAAFSLDAGTFTHAAPLTSKEDHFVGSFRPGGPPRSHHLTRRWRSWVLLERRSVVDQQKSLVAPGALVRFDLETSIEDTLRTFLASSYSHQRGSLVICCGPPPMFSPQAHWAIIDSSTVAFTNGRENQIHLVSDVGASVKSIRLDLESARLSMNQKVAYAVTSSRGHKSIFELAAHAIRWRTQPHRLREAFSDTVPTITQMFVLHSDLVAARHFDAEAYPHGLSEQWTLVRLSNGAPSGLHLPGIEVVHDMNLVSGSESDTLAVLWSRRKDSNVNLFKSLMLIRRP